MTQADGEKIWENFARDPLHIVQQMQQMGPLVSIAVHSCPLRQVDAAVKFAA